MIHTIRTIETVLLVMTGLVMCLGLFKVLSTPVHEREKHTFTVVFFFIGVLTEILAIGLLWI